jgi:transglutaminase-like putative cysteine protease
MCKALKSVIVTLAFFLVQPVLAQENGFPFGRTLFSELDMKSYAKDTNAVAVVLQEFGEAYIDSDELNLRFEYHVKMKILKPGGLKYGNVELVLHRQGGKEETINTLQASSFNLENGRIVESKMADRAMFKREANEYTVVQSFAIPNVKVGSVVEYKYHMESPWLQNFQPWEFQEEIPKVKSEYWATIPAYYRYNVTLKGYLQLSLNEGEVLRNAFSAPGVGTADCSRMKYAMDNIPAFREEEYMTAPSNYMARLNFELLAIHYPDGRIDKVTTEWRDAVNELKSEPRFGGQIRRGKNILEGDIAPIVAGIDDPLTRARKVYDFVKNQYEWNGVYGKYSEHGIRKALDNRTGNVGDINLTLVAALRAADIAADPVILSTRANGFPIEIHPVITDFNYVIATAKLGDKQYLLDATDDFLPFGLVPEKCINGKGRVLPEDESYWLPLTAPGNKRWVSTMSIKMAVDGKLTGSLSTSYFGYAAVDERKTIYEIRDEKEYIQKTRPFTPTSVTNIVRENIDDVDKPLIVKFDFESDASSEGNASSWLFNPFFISSWRENPFKSAERFYPVDFGVPIDERMIVSIEFPEGYQVKSMPENVALGLPNNGGRYVFLAKSEGNKATFSSNFAIARTYYSPEEYHFLKELFARMIQTQATDILIEKK